MAIPYGYVSAIADGTIIDQSGSPITVVKTPATSGTYVLTLTAPGFAEGLGSVNLDCGEPNCNQGYDYHVVHTSDTVKQIFISTQWGDLINVQFRASVGDVP